MLNCTKSLFVIQRVLQPRVLSTFTFSTLSVPLEPRRLPTSLLTQSVLLSPHIPLFTSSSPIFLNRELRLYSTQPPSPSSSPPSSSSSSSSTTPPPPAESWTKRSMAKIKHYGKVGLATWLVVDLISLGILTGLIHNGVDLVMVLDKLGISHERFENLGNSLISAWLLALAFNKLTLPLRLPIALYLTPKVHRWWTNEEPISSNPSPKV